jgi:hypothetical protein
VAGGAETSHPAGVRHEELIPALGAAHPGEALLEIAAFQELAHHRADDRAPETIALLVTLFIDRLELQIEPLDQLIEGCLLGLTAEVPNVPDAPALDPKLQAAIEAIANGRPDSEIVTLIAQLKAESVDAALHASQDRAQAFDAAVKPLSQTIDVLAKLLSTSPSAGTGKSISRDFTAARLRYAAQRYDAEARLNQAIGNLHEVQVHLSNFAAERHRVRSQRFFYGMLIAQAAVIVSTLAMAARQRNVLWSLAAAAGLVAIAFAIYVYLWV